MPSGGVGRIEGMKEAREALQQLTRTVQRNVGRRALAAGPGKVFVRAISARAKVSGRAGDPTRGSLKASPKVVSARAKKGAAAVAVLVDDPAAVPKEKGLARRNYPAEPFMRPAVDASRDEAAQAMAAEVKREVDEAARRAAKGKK